MPAWIHGRAEHLLAKNPSMDKSQAFAIATQQSHKLGKSPKGYGTAEGKAEAKEKYDKPKKDYVKGANPGKLKSSKMEKTALSPMMGKQLLGVGLGAGVGALGGAAAAGEGHRLRGALMGGAGGAAVGGAAGYAVPRMQSAMKAGLGFRQSANMVGQDLRAHSSNMLQRASNAISPAKKPVSVPSYAEAASAANAQAMASPRVSTGQMREYWFRKANEGALQKLQARMGGTVPGNATPSAVTRATRAGTAGTAPSVMATAGHPAMMRPDVATRAVGPRMDMTTKVGFAVSQYSGDMGPGKFEGYAGYVPPFRKPEFKRPKEEPVKTAGKATAEGKSNRNRALAGVGASVVGSGAMGAGGFELLNNLKDNDALFDAVRSKAPVRVLEAGKDKIEADIPNWRVLKPHKAALEEALSSSYRDRAMNGGVFMANGLKGGPAAIVGSHAPELLAHELGHADIHGSRLGRLVQNPLTTGIGALGTHSGIGFAAGYATGKSDNDKVRTLGAWAPAIAAAPMLAYEGGASLLGMRRLRQAGAAKADLAHSAKQLGRAWSTYAGRAAAGTGSAQLGSAIGRARRAKEKQTEATVKAAAMVDEFAKLNAVSSPKAQLAKAQQVGAPKVTAPAGPSIAQVAKPIGFGRPLPGATKTAADKLALLERLVRLGATDVPKTPRLLMRHRSPAELGALQRGVEGWWGNKVTKPLMGVAEKGLSKLPEGKLRNAATSGAKLIAEDPAGMLLSNLVPLPGANPTYLALKKGGEKLIDRLAPVP